MAKPAAEFLDRLRMATRPIHKSVEVLIDSDRMLVNAPELSRYQQFLAAHYLLHRQVARHSARVVDQAPDSALLDWPQCPRLTALEEDLRQLDVAIDVSRHAELPIQTHGFTLGLVYVCEGSCIGNQRVLSALCRHECFVRWNGHSFLSSCKAGFADRWKALLLSMHQLCSDTSDIDLSGYEELERGAIAGFQLYRDYWTALECAMLARNTKHESKAA